MTGSNQIETYELNGSKFTYDHATGVATAKHANGYIETWSPRRHGYSLHACFRAYLLLTEQMDRFNDAGEAGQ